MVTDSQSTLMLWRDHFSLFLQGYDDSNTAHRGVNSTDSNGKDEEVPPINSDDIRIAIRRLKNNMTSGTDGLSGELF